MKKLSVLLIQPSYRDCVQTLFSIYNTEEGIGFKPPLGLLYIAAAIRNLTPHRVDVLDCQLDDAHHANIAQFLAKDYDVVGISAWTDFWFQAAALSGAIKTLMPRCLVVMGGPHVNAYPAEVLDFPSVDAIVMGDGEIPMVRLLSRLSAGAADEVPGLYLKGQAGPFVPHQCRDLDKLPMPDRTMLPVKRYTSVLGSERYVTTMITSRGCPFACVYCKMKHQPFCKRSADNVLAEFEQISALGINEVEVYDDTFNFDHQRTLAICRGLRERGLKFKWAIRDRVDRVEPRVLDELRLAGCNRVHLGVESGSDRVLGLIGKKITVAQAKRAVALAKERGFEVLTYYMFGLPGETYEEALQTIDLALSLDSDYAEFSITIPYPGTRAYAEALEKGVISRDFWLEFTRNPTPAFAIPQVIENLIPREQLMELRNSAIRRYYFRPSYLFRELKKVRSWHELRRKLGMGLGLANVLRGVFVR